MKGDERSNVIDSVHGACSLTWEDGPVQEGKVLKEPGMAEVTDGKVALNQEHVLEEGARGVRAIGHAFIQRAIRHIL